MGMQNTQASYPRVCTHESQSFSTELLESKGTGSEHLPQSHHLIFTFLLCIFLLTAQFSYCLHTTAQFSKSRLLLRFEIDMSDNIYALSVGKPWPSDNRKVFKPKSGCIICSKSGGTADRLEIMSSS